MIDTDLAEITRDWRRANRHCCPRCGWHLTAHASSHGPFSDCPGGQSPSARDGSLARLHAALGPDGVRQFTRRIREDFVRPEGPEDGHTFRIEVHSRGSYAHVQPDGSTSLHTDADWMGEPPLTLEVRAWSLRAALQKALEHPLPDWSREGHRLGDPPPEKEASDG